MAIRIANAPCSWGVLEFDLAGQPQAFAEVLDEMASTGYTGTELGDWGFLPSEPKRLGEELSRRNLEMVGAFVPVALWDEKNHAPGLKIALRTARLLAAVAERPWIVLADENATVQQRVAHAGRVPPELGLSDEAWDRFAQGAQWLAREVFEQTGVRTVFHHHCAGYVETPSEIETLLERTDPQWLGLCLDTGHYAFGGGDPLQVLQRHRDRIRHVHFKDCQRQIAERARSEAWDYFQAVRSGVFCELGQGSVDFPAIARCLTESGYDGWIVVEQDVLPGMGTPLESAQRNREYLRSLKL